MVQDIVPAQTAACRQESRGNRQREASAQCTRAVVVAWCVLHLTASSEQYGAFGAHHDQHLLPSTDWSGMMEKIKIEQHSFSGTLWVGGWLFTIGYLHLAFRKGVLA